jgi:D-glycero-alpha-D-manno-heptose-7-phosphate kinase
LHFASSSAIYVDHGDVKISEETAPYRPVSNYGAMKLADGDQQEALKRMVELAYQLRKELQKGNLASVGDILDENWILKRTLASNVSTDQIDSWYHAAKNAGAMGGKILGAGSGGFLMFYAEEDRHEEIKRSLPLRCMSFRFEPLGSRIIFYHP